METHPSAVTPLLFAWRQGKAQAGNELMPRVYDRLRRMAVHHLGNERSNHTLQPTALVHECYLRLIQRRSVNWQDRRHFFAVAARTMRAVLIDHARGRRRAKRGGGHALLPIEAASPIAENRAAELVAVDDAMRDLAALDPVQALIVELRFFGGLSVAEVSAVVQRSPRTVARMWRSARAWLSRELARQR